MRYFTLALGLVLALSSLLSAQNYTPYFEVKFPDDRTVYGCGASVDTVYPIITPMGYCPYAVGVSVKDQVFYTNDNQSCYKIQRRFRLIYWCDYSANLPFTYVPNWPQTDVGPTVLGHSGNRGALEYFQLIKVRDTVPPVFIDCPAGPVTFCDYGANDPAQYHSVHQDRCEGPVELTAKATDVCSGADLVWQYRLYLDLDGNGTMETLVSSGTPGAWPITTTQTGTTLQARIAFPAGYELPYGTHKVEWIVGDNCGNDAVCKYDFIVKDCKKPTVVCLNGISANLMQTGMVTVADSTLLVYTFDNCTPASALVVGLRKAGAGTGFPAGQHTVTFTCAELGPQPVELWSIDAAGNADFCLTYVDVQDNMGNCAPPLTPLAGAVATDAGQPLPGVALALLAPGDTLPTAFATSDSLGAFAFDPAPADCGYTVSAALDTLPNAGVTVYDAMLLNFYLAGFMPLPSPYRVLAADADRSGLLTSNDVKEITRVALGLQPAFANSPSWRFVPTGFVFPDAYNPLATAVPDVLDVCLGTPAAPNANFVAIKVGDLDGSALPAATANRVADETAYFSVPALRYGPGDDVRVPVRVPALSALGGFQFTLEYDPAALELLRVEPGLTPAEQVGLFAGQPRLTASWIAGGFGVGDGRPAAFTLVFRATAAGALERDLGMSSAIAAAQAYTRDLHTHAAALAFDPVAADARTPILFPVQPNPARDRVRAAFYVPEAGAVTLRLLDAAGQVLESRAIAAVAGSNQAEFDLGERSGTLVLQLLTAQGMAVQRFVAVD